MSFNLMLFNNSITQKQAVSEIMFCNEMTEQYSLMLTAEQAIELVETRSFSLQNFGRIEFGGGIIEKIILAFYNSPYISPDNYMEVLHELIEIFYYFKNETLDLMSDDELLKYMKKYFNGVCYGSLDQLKSKELERMARNIRFGYAPNYDETNEVEEIMEVEEYNE